MSEGVGGPRWDLAMKGDFSDADEVDRECNIWTAPTALRFDDYAEAVRGRVGCSGRWIIVGGRCCEWPEKGSERQSNQSDREGGRRGGRLHKRSGDEEGRSGGCRGGCWCCPK